MEKAYYEHIQWWDYLIYLVYNGLLAYLLGRVGEIALNIGKQARVLFFIAFEVYFLLVIGDSLFHYLPYLPDSELYSYMISSGQYPETSSENLIVIYYISIFLSIICLNDPVIFTFFCIFLYALGAMLFIQAWKKADPSFNTNSETSAALLFLLWPAAALYITTPLREAFIMFGFGLFLNGFMDCIYKGKWRSVIIGSIIICAIRLQLFVFVLPVLGALVVYKSSLHKIWKSAILVGTIVAAFLVVRYVLVEHPLSPQTMAQLRNVNLDNAGPLGYGRVDWDSYTDMARDYPFIIAQFLFSPFPIFVQHDPLSTFVPFLDCLFLIFLLILIFSRFKALIRQHLPVLLLCVFYIILFGGYEYHITGAVRHRMPLEALFILMAAPALSRIIFRKKHAAA
ncbi:MAG: hypothetical protein K1X40_08120 [Chitinophagales bacterium]|nr:hypothetical protein [Chitinophagales bacterium]